jgi:hypothetical protein
MFCSFYYNVVHPEFKVLAIIHLNNHHCSLFVSDSSSAESPSCAESLAPSSWPTSTPTSSCGGTLPPAAQRGNSPLTTHPWVIFFFDLLMMRVMVLCCSYGMVEPYIHITGVILATTTTTTTWHRNRRRASIIWLNINLQYTICFTTQSSKH